MSCPPDEAFGDPQLHSSKTQHAASEPAPAPSNPSTAPNDSASAARDEKAVEYETIRQAIKKYNREASGVDGIVQTGARLGRFVYNHNPFYIASAWMVFRGLHATFNVGEQNFPSGALTLSLMGYILLLTITAALVVRYGKVWDDARTLMLLIVLMLLGVSVTLDDVLAARPALGVVFGCGGWLFAVAISEGLLRSIRLRLPAWYRIAYHLLLALIYLYPLSLAPHLTDPNSPTLRWLLYGFSWAVALAMLTLAPAIRRGSSYVNDNGSPWRWPLYPWTLFGMLIGCAGLRAWYMCLALHSVDYNDSIFGPYFVAPLVLAAGLLLSEAGVVTKNAWLGRLALASPIVAVVLAVSGHSQNRVYQDFLTLYQQTLGSPLYVTLGLAAAFYAVETLRRRRWAGDLLAVTLLALACLRTDALGFQRPVDLRPWALASVGVWQGWLFVRHRRALTGVLASAGLIAALTGSLAGSWFTDYHYALPWHLGLAACLIAAALCKDETAKWIEAIGVWTLSLLALTVVAPGNSLPGEVPEALRIFYPPAVAAVLIAYAALTKHWIQCGAAAVIPLSLWLVIHSGQSFDIARRHVRGLTQLLWGLLFFVCAALLSLFKTAAGQRWLKHWTGQSKPLNQAPGPPSGERFEA